MKSTNYPVEDHPSNAYRLVGESGAVLLDVRRTSNARDLRGALVSLAYALKTPPESTWAICALTGSRLSADRVRQELAQFRSLVGSTLGQQIFLVAVDRDRVDGELPSADPSLKAAVVGAAQRGPGSKVPRQAVMSAAMQAWLDGETQLGVAALRRRTRASYPTVAAALEELTRLGALMPDDKGYAYPSELPWHTWRRLAEGHAEGRKTIRFADPSGLARKPEDMVRRLAALQGEGHAAAVEVAGVLGAERYYPGLDITAALRLDLCVYDGDVSFVRMIDAGLVETSGPKDKAVLVVHLAHDINHRRGRFEPLKVASMVDCLAALLDIGHQAEAADFIRAMQAQRNKGGCRDA